MNANIREIRAIRGQSRFRRVTTSYQTTKKLKGSSTKVHAQALPGFRGVFQLAAAHDFAPKGV
jgi:hypothetical protein